MITPFECCRRDHLGANFGAVKKAPRARRAAAVSSEGARHRPLREVSLESPTETRMARRSSLPGLRGILPIALTSSPTLTRARLVGCTSYPDPMASTRPPGTLGLDLHARGMRQCGLCGGRPGPRGRIPVVTMKGESRGSHRARGSHQLYDTFAHQAYLTAIDPLNRSTSFAAALIASRVS